MATTDPDLFLRVLRGLVRPLVRTMVARGITAPAFYRLIKSVYVDVAREDFRLGEAPPTDSRISLLTGVHRRDVRALSEAGDDGWAGARAKTAAFATVIARWRAEAEWRDADGPRPLTRPEFDSLVAGVSRDIRARTVLDELLRQAVVTEAADGRLALAEEAIAGPASQEDRLVFFAANVGDHMAAAVENLLADEPPFLERAVFYNRLTPAAVDEIEAEARLLSQDVLERLSERSAALQREGAETPGNMERYRFGLYFYREAPAAPDDEDRA